MLHIKLAKDKMENEEGMNHLLVEVEPELSTEKVTKPIAVLLVLDNSGSMDDEVETKEISRKETNTKLDYAKQASIRLIDTLRDGDKLGIVSFSSIANKEYPLTTINQDEKFKMKDRIMKIETIGATNVSDGLETAYEQIVEDLKKTHHIKMILVSDGQANYGIRDVDGISTLVSGYRDNEVSVSTIGVGVDYNAFYMESIATASGGMFYHLEDMNMLNEIFTQELETLVTLTTKQAKVVVNLPEGIKIEKNLNDFQEKITGEAFVGNVFSKQSILFEIFTEKAVEIGTKKLSITYSYQDANGTKKTIEKEVELSLVTEDDMEDVHTNSEVVALVKQLLEAKAQKEAMRSYEIGNIGAATTHLQNSIEKMSEMSNYYDVDASESLLNMKKLNESVNFRSLDKNMTKALYSQSYSVSRNTKNPK